VICSMGRTAQWASTCVYASHPESRKLALIGSGWLAYTHVLAHCAVRPIEQITVYSPNEAHREALCRELTHKVEAELIPVDSARTAMKDVDIVSAVTNSYEPVFSGDWLEPGQYVTSVQGSELDDRTPDRAAIIVTRAMEPATFAAPPGCDPKEADWFRRWRSDWRVKLRELGRIVAGSQAGRDSSEDITLFGSGGTTPSHGIAIQYAAAAIAYQRARERGMGYEVPSELFLEAFHP